MKKFILNIIFLITSFFSFSQTVVQQNWKTERPGEWASFNWAVTRAKNADSHGKFYYHIYFFSNSYFNSKSNGLHYDKASTYVRDIKITMYEYKYNGYGKLYVYNTVTVNVPYFTCDWFYSPENYVAWFWSYSPYTKFTITYSKVSAFDYSIY
jgi:hypothetical protein